MPRVPAHLCEHALGMLQGGMRTADVARAIKYNVHTVSHLRQCYRETGRTADHPRSSRPRVTTGKKCFEVIGFSNAFLWGSQIIRTQFAVPMASTRCQQPLEIVLFFF